METQTLITLALIAVVGLIQSSFQLSVSVLTLLSSHTIGRRRSHKRLIVLTNSFATGVAVMTILLLSLITLLAQYIVSVLPSTEFLWVVISGLLAGLGVAVWLFYYHRGPGTVLWVPRQFARFLTARAKATKQATEAFSLGMASVISELLFLFVPLVVSGLLLVSLSLEWQIVGLMIYGLTALLSLLIVNGLIGSGHSISRIQRWREANKRFLQFSAGSGLLILGFYLYVDQVLTTSVMTAAGAL